MSQRRDAPIWASTSRLTCTSVGGSDSRSSSRALSPAQEHLAGLAEECPVGRRDVEVPVEIAAPDQAGERADQADQYEPSASTARRLAGKWAVWSRIAGRVRVHQLRQLPHQGGAVSGKPELGAARYSQHALKREAPSICHWRNRGISFASHPTRVHHRRNELSLRMTNRTGPESRADHIVDPRR